jgi:riboflavin synthase
VFTGLIADLGTLGEIRRDATGATLTIETRLSAEIAPGDSVAVNGVCLTAAAVGPEGFSAQAMPETLRRSSLGDLEAREQVNLELALPADGRIGGHIVQGHVDGVGTVREVSPDGFARVLRIELPGDQSLGRYLVEKGSLAVDGVSLTVSAIDEDSVSVSLIPETLERTNLGAAAPGRRVNLEVDILAKQIERLLRVPA